MNIEEAIDSVNAFFKTAWEASSSVPIYWDGTPINDVPTDNTTTKEVTPFIVVWTEVLKTEQATIGAAPNRRFRRNGVITIRLMSPPKQGRLLSDQLAKIVFDSLEGTCTPEGVELFSPQPLPSFKAGAYLVKQINVDFEYDEIK